MSKKLYVVSYRTFFVADSEDDLDKKAQDAVRESKRWNAEKDFELIEEVTSDRLNLQEEELNSLPWLDNTELAVANWIQFTEEDSPEEK